MSYTYESMKTTKQVFSSAFLFLAICVLMSNCGVGVAPCRASERPVMAWDLVNVEAMSYELLLNGAGNGKAFRNT